MTIYSELSRIQKELKAPKGQFNKFGNYKYRSCEDILEAVKPLLNECSLTVTDEVILIGERFYIKATAKLSLSKDEYIENSALAREPETKKGMDEAQITGATSSYARKYALNGLFCIDDTKDADATNTHGKDEQAEAFEKQAKAEKTAKTKALNKGEDIPAPTLSLDDRYNNCLAWIKKQTADTFLKETPARKDSVLSLMNDLKDKGCQNWYETLNKEYQRVTELNDGLPDFLQGEPTHDYRV